MSLQGKNWWVVPMSVPARYAELGSAGEKPKNGESEESFSSNSVSVR